MKVTLLIVRLTADPFSKFASLLGRINDKPAILTLEKTAFGNDLPSTTKETEYPSLKLIQRNDIYRWYLASISEGKYSIKATIIYPATDVHIRKHEKQRRRMVRETPDIYKEHIENYIQTMKGSRIQWYNIFIASLISGCIMCWNTRLRRRRSYLRILIQKLDLCSFRICLPLIDITYV